MLFRVLLVPTLLAGLCAGQHPRKNNALAPEVRQRAEALLRSAGDPRTSHDEIWRSCCETHGTIQPLLDWLDTKLDGPDSNTTRRLLARIQRRAGHLEPALHTLEAIPAKARTNADEIARAEVLDALGRDTDALAVYTALTKRDLEPALEKKILLRRALMGKRLTALAAFAKDKTKTRAQRNEAAIVLAIMGDQKTAISTFGVSGEGTARFRQQIRRAEWAIEAKDFDAAQVAAWDAVKHGKLSRDRRYALSVLASAYRRDGAVGELLAHLEKDKNIDAERRQLWVRLLREEGRTNDALRLFHEAAAGTFDSKARRQLLEICRETGRDDVLVQTFQKLVREEPQNLEWRSGLSRHYLEKGERARATAVWNDFDDTRQPSKALMAAAYSLQAIGLDRVAEKLARKAGTDPTVRSMALLFVFQMHLDEGNQDAALKALGELASANPSRNIRANIAGGYERLGRPDLALATLEGLRKELGGFLGSDLEMKLAILLSRVEREEEALAVWRSLWSRMRATPRGRFVEDRMMTVASRLGALAKIAIQLEDRLKAGKAGTEDVEMLVRLYIKVGDPASATEIIELFLKQTGADSAEVLRRKAKIYLSCQDYHHYEKVIHELVVKDPENRLDHLRELAMSQLERGRRDLTVALLPKIRAESGDNIQMADEFEAGIYGLCGMKDKSLEAYVKGIARHPNRIDTYLLISNLMRETGREMQAARMFQYLAQTAVRDDLFTIAIDGILNLRAARRTLVPTKLVRWARRLTLERLATRPHRFYLYRLVTDLASELNDMPFAIRTLKSALPVAGERRTPVMRELMSKVQMTDPAALRAFGQARFQPSKDWDATDYVMVGRRLIGQGDHVPPQTFMNLASIFLREGDVAAAMRTFNRAAEVLDYVEVLREAARVLEDSGRAKHALKYYRRLLATGSDDVGLILKIGNLEEQLGNTRVAFDSYQRGVRKVLDNKPRYLSHADKKKPARTLYYRGGNVSAEDAAFPQLIQGLLLTASKDEVATFLEGLAEKVQADLASVSRNPKTADDHRLTNYPRLATGANLWRMIALTNREFDAAAAFDTALMHAFAKDSAVSIDVVSSRSSRGFAKSARQLLDASPHALDPQVRLAAGVVDRSATSLAAAAAAKLVPSLLGTDPAPLLDLLERVDTGRMSAADKAAIPTLLATCVLVGATDAGARFARAGIRHANGAARSGMALLLTLVDRLKPGVAHSLLRDKMTSIAANKPKSIGSFLMQFIDIDSLLGGGTLTSDAAKKLALAMAKNSERYIYYLGTLLAWVDSDERPQVAREMHDALPRSARVRFLLSVMDFLGDRPVDNSYVEWFKRSLKDGLEADGDSILSAARLPVARSLMLGVPVSMKRSPELMLCAIEVFEELRPESNHLIARIHVLLHQKKVEAAFELGAKTARTILKGPARQQPRGLAIATARQQARGLAIATARNPELQRLVRAFNAPEHRTHKGKLIARLHTDFPKNKVVTGLYWSHMRLDRAAYVPKLEQAVAADPKNIDLLSRLAQAESSYGWKVRSLRRYEQLIKLHSAGRARYERQVQALKRQLQLPVMAAKKPKPAPGTARRILGARLSALLGSTTVTAIRTVSVAGAYQHPGDTKINKILELWKAGKKDEAKRAFRRLWRNFEPVNQYIKFPQNLTYFSRQAAPGQPEPARTVFGRLEKELPFIPEEARAALRILDVNPQADPFGRYLLPVREELLDIVGRDLVQRKQHEEAIRVHIASVLNGTARSLDVGLLLRLITATKDKPKELPAVSKMLVKTAPSNSPESLQRLARLCAQGGDPERAKQLYRLSMLVGGTRPALGILTKGEIGRLRPEIEQHLGDQTKSLLLDLIDDAGTQASGYGLAVWAGSAMKLWSELLPAADAATRMAKLKARLLTMSNTSRYVGTQTPHADIVAATFARAGRTEEALEEAAAWLRRTPTKTSTPRLLLLRGKVRSNSAKVTTAILDAKGKWTDRPAWLRALAARVLEWHSTKVLLSPEQILGKLSKQLASAGDRELAERCVAALSPGKSILPTDRLTYATALRGIEHVDDALALEEQLFREQALPVDRIGAVVQHIVERDGSEAGLKAGAAATQYTHAPTLLDVLATTAEKLGRQDEAKRWRAMKPKEPKKPKTAPRSQSRRKR